MLGRIVALLGLMLNWSSRWQSGAWQPWTVSVHVCVIADIVTFAAFLSLTVCLANAYFRNKAHPFRTLTGLFSLFIFTCGIAHIISAFIFWYPIYTLLASVNTLTAVLSVITAIASIGTMPALLHERSGVRLQQEIEERNQLERQSRFNRMRLKTIFETAHDIIITTNQVGNIITFNPAAEAAFQRECDAVLDTFIGDLLATQYRDELRLKLQHYAPTSDIYVTEGLRLAGELFPLELTIAAWDFDGLRHYTFIGRDVTERAQVLHQLEQHRELLECQIQHRGVLEGEIAALKSLQSTASEQITMTARALETLSAVSARCVQLMGETRQQVPLLPQSSVHGAANVGTETAG